VKKRERQSIKHKLIILVELHQFKGYKWDGFFLLSTKQLLTSLIILKKKMYRVYGVNQGTPLGTQPQNTKSKANRTAMREFKSLYKQRKRQFSVLFSLTCILLFYEPGIPTGTSECILHVYQSFFFFFCIK
jgi:hypothetical protein